MDQAVVEKALFGRQAIVKERSVFGLLFWMEDLVMVALAVVVASAERSGLFLLELLQVSLLGGLVVGSNQAGIPHVPLRDVKLATKLCMAMSQIAEECNPLNISQIASNTRDPDPGIFPNDVHGLWGGHKH
jgi:hypothetical protein